MKSLDGRFARMLVAILVIATLPACNTDSVTEPPSPNAILRIEALTSMDFTGTVGEWVDPVPTVVVRDERGKTVAGARVVFRPVAGSAPNANPLTYVTTDSRGLANPGNWKLGTMAGVHSLEARLVDERYYRSDSGRVVVFRVEAKAAAPDAFLVAAFPPDTLSLPGAEMATPIFTVVDRFKNGVGGVIVTFAVTGGGGSLAITQQESSRWGTASPGTWTLGPSGGLNTFVVSAPGMQPFTLKARALDVGAVTWYNLERGSSDFIEEAAIGLGQDGTFELSIESWYPEDAPERLRGKYTISGTAIVLVFATGVTEQGTLVGNDLSFLHKIPELGNYPAETWKFVKRSASNALTVR
jgi:hypothetical protein